VSRSIPVAAALLCACGAEFVEPHPPWLLRERIDYRASSAAEPAVWLIVSDLFLEHDEDCAATVAWLGSAIRAAVPASVAATFELAPIQISPCTQPNARSLDPAAIDAALRTAEAAFPGRSVRAVLVYANNVLLAVPSPISASLEAARRLVLARGALEPRIWTLLPATVGNTVRADRTIAWTYAGDPATAGQIAQVAADELPFTSDAGMVTLPLPLFAGGPPGVRVFKICAIDQGVQTVGFVADGSAVEVDPSHPPEYRVTLAGRRAVPHLQFQPLNAGLEFEACLDHCDRYYGVDPVRWLTRPGCLLPGGPP